MNYIAYYVNLYDEDYISLNTKVFKNVDEAKEFIFENPLLRTALPTAIIKRDKKEESVYFSNKIFNKLHNKDLIHIDSSLSNYKYVANLKGYITILSLVESIKEKLSDISNTICDVVDQDNDEDSSDNKKEEKEQNDVKENTSPVIQNEHDRYKNIFCPDPAILDDAVRQIKELYGEDTTVVNDINYALDHADIDLDSKEYGHITGKIYSVDITDSDAGLYYTRNKIDIL